jgi:hypothetical protein
MEMGIWSGIHNSKGFRDESNNKKMEGKTERNACAKDTVSEYEIIFN